MDTNSRINQRLEKLREYVGILESLKGTNARELVESIEKRAKAERFLQLAAEVVIDIAEIIVAQKKLPTPSTSAEALERLGEAGILDKEFTGQFAKIAGFRNILIHDYLDIDYEKVADKINNRLGDFDLFARKVAQYLTSNPSS